MCDFKIECATTLCHAEAGAMNLLRPTPDRLTKHLYPCISFRQQINCYRSCTPLLRLRYAPLRMTVQLTTDPEVTHDVIVHIRVQFNAAFSIANFMRIFKHTPTCFGQDIAFAVGLLPHYLRQHPLALSLQRHYISTDFFS